MTNTEAAVLAALRSGGQLSTSTLATTLRRRRWRVARAARSLHRQGLIVQNARLRWQMYCTAAVTR